MTGFRTTIILDEDLLKKLRVLHSKMVKDSTKSVSLSKVINGVIKRGLKA